MAVDHSTYAREHGHDAEDWMVTILSEAGMAVRPGSHDEDTVLKVDFWVQHPRTGRWLPVQFTTSRRSVCTEKCMDALTRGVLISKLSYGTLEAWAMGRKELGKKILSQFWSQLDQILLVFPSIRLLEPSINGLGPRRSR